MSVSPAVELRPSIQDIPDNASCERAFGVYRLLTEDSEREVREVMLEAADEANDHIRRYGSGYGSFELNETFAITYVPRKQVALSLKRGRLKDVYNPELAVEELIRCGLWPSEDNKLEVSLGGLGWFKPRNKKMGPLLQPDDPNYKEVQSQAECIEEWIGRLCDGLQPDVQVRCPNHVTFLRYGNNRNVRPLTPTQRQEIEKIVQRRLYRRRITAVMLGSLVIGSSYNTPHNDFKDVLSGARSLEQQR